MAMLPQPTLLSMYHKVVVIALDCVTERWLAQKFEKMQRMREQYKAHILWLPPILQVLDVLNKLGLVEVLVLS